MSNDVTDDDDTFIEVEIVSNDDGIREIVIDPNDSDDEIAVEDANACLISEMIYAPAIPGKKQLQLYPNQMDAVEKCMKNLDESPYCINTADMGEGKTYFGAFISQLMNPMTNYRQYRVTIVVAPPTVCNKWAQLNVEYGLNIVSIMSYQSLISRKFKQPNNPYMIREDYKERKIASDRSIIEVNRVVYRPTQYYLDHVNYGNVLLIFDEMQGIKNDSLTRRACAAFIKPVMHAFKRASKSRILMLSYTPIDQEKHAGNFFKTMDIFNTDKLSQINPQTQEMRWVGMQQIHDYCVKLEGGDMTNIELSQINATNGNLHMLDAKLPQYIIELWFNVILARNSVVIVPDLTAYRCKINVRNVFYNMRECDNKARWVRLLEEGIRKMKLSSRFNERTGEVDLGGNDGLSRLLGINAGIAMIETAMVQLVCRWIGLEELRRNPNAKIIFAMNSTGSIDDLMQYYAHYRPLRLDGKVTQQARINVLNSFQAPSTDHRVLIGNSTVMQSGIDLDDKDGKFERTLYVSPSFYAMVIQQLLGRTMRRDTMSNSTVNMMYINGHTQFNVLNAITRKFAIMQRTHAKLNKPGLATFPNAIEDPKTHAIALTDVVPN